jgi:septal ring factor EnvC (AmiA/AmiB activator)
VLVIERCAQERGLPLRPSATAAAAGLSFCHVEPTLTRTREERQRQVERQQREIEKLREQSGERDQQIADAEKQIGEQQKQIAGLEQQLALRKQNSRIPPNRHPPMDWPANPRAGPT